MRFPPLVAAGLRVTLALPLRGVRDALLRSAYRRAFAAFSRGDWELNTLAHDPERFAFTFAGAEGSRPPGARDVYQGIDGYLEFMGLWTSSWADIRPVLDDVVYVDPSRLVIVFRQVVRGSGSGVTVDQAMADIHEFRKGRLVRQVFWGKRDEILRSVGITVAHSRHVEVAGGDRESAA